jgi:hypothetical protein
MKTKIITINTIWRIPTGSCILFYIIKYPYRLNIFSITSIQENTQGLKNFLFVFNIIFVWNEFLFNFQLGGLKTYGIPVGLFTSITKGGQVDWSFVASIGTLYVLPLALVIYFFQKYLLVGLTFGTVRGEV